MEIKPTKMTGKRWSGVPKWYNACIGRQMSGFESRSDPHFDMFQVLAKIFLNGGVHFTRHVFYHKTKKESLGLH